MIEAVYNTNRFRIKSELESLKEGEVKHFTNMPRNVFHWLFFYRKTMKASEQHLLQTEMVPEGKRTKRTENEKEHEQIERTRKTLNDILSEQKRFPRVNERK